ncbi:MAG: hypothetical protein A2V69_03820 [Candidatus Portnoybacteria bacterium RBG_13_40_8]|uniref:DUF4410 domain-containing protein n=1 Tax=Candidatus Portnoybacteria bacterium RBG_13_40_8 TaxID=1801990 RepID=A0A1G2F6N5_9BACT|nr:MAG: hypothetical protein A2V69_03820 [Candidatus Portnoybacteria bacterium RBG_13_40_8]
MTPKTINHNKIFLFILIYLCIFFTMSCAKLTAVKSVEDASFRKDAPLEKIYTKIIIQRFEVDQDLERDFPDATVICESTAMNELLKNNVAPKIEKARLSTSREAAALIVKTRITTLKLASSSARGLSGAFMGNSEMAASVRLVDAGTRKTLREKNFSTNKSSATASSGGNSDSSMPYDLGKMIAEYIAETVRRN